MQPSNINVIAELERCGLDYAWAGEREVKLRCPFHDDHSPTCHVNVQEGVFKCHAAGCSQQGDVVTLLAKVLECSRQVMLVELGTRYLIEDVKTVEPAAIERWHKAIWEAGPLLRELYARALTDDDIRQYRLGVDGSRITIPIKNASGDFVNVRKYLPGAPGADKMKNMRGRSKARLFPIDQMKYEKIVLCGGECKAIVAARLLNPHGFGAVSPTCGEGNWEHEFTPMFKEKQVWVTFDVDPEGQASANMRCAQLRTVVDWVGNAVLPLDIDRFPHGDVNDFVANGGDLLAVLHATPEWERPRTAHLDDSEPEKVMLADAINAELTGRRVAIKCVVPMLDTAPYVIPKDLLVDCDKSQKECAICPVMQTGEARFLVHPESSVILDMVATHKNIQRDVLMREIGIPASCKACEVVPQAFFNVEDARVSPELDITNRTADRVMQPAICIGDGLELNENYNMVGRMYPHPKTQQSTLLISKYDPTKDALSTYKCECPEELEVFQPAEWTEQGVRDKLGAIYSDFESNVSHIFRRQAMHLMVDLAYHSPLLMTFDERVVKGWVEVLIMGDSSQGKSEVTMSMMQHYQLGEKIECKNATVPGMLGGLQKHGDRWFVTWGVMPIQDKRLVIWEELKGASTEIISKLTDMRSSGIAEIPKIEKRRTHARTRVIALSNPRSEGRTLSSYNFGIVAVKELIGNLEDIRRFDAALLVSSSEVDSREINELRRNRPKVEHTYSQQLCRSLVLWCWTREPSQVKFTDDAVTAVLDESTKLCEQFTEAIPLVDRGSMRYKLARLSAACAGRTFSREDDALVVRSCHVSLVAGFLRRTYGSHVFGYADFTEAIRSTEQVHDPGVLKKKIEELPFPKDFVKHLLHANWVDLYDLQDWCGWERTEAQELLSLLVRKYALHREGRKYKKSPEFILLLKKLLEDGLEDRPDHIPEF